MHVRPFNSVVASEHPFATRFAAFRKNPWPYAVAGYFILFSLAMSGFIAWAVRQRIDLVRPDYYDAELRYQGHLEQAGRARTLRTDVSVTWNAARQSLMIALPPAHARGHAVGEIVLYRPADSRLDCRFPLALRPDGTQQINTRNLRGGWWKAQLTWQAGGEGYYHEQSFVMDSGNF